MYIVILENIPHLLHCLTPGLHIIAQVKYVTHFYLQTRNRYYNTLSFYSI